MSDLATLSTATPTEIKDQLSAPFTLSKAQIRKFREEGFIKLKDVLSSDVLAHYQQEITELTFEHNPAKGVALEDKDLYGKAFIQVGNLWEKSVKAAEFIFSKRLAGIATQLLGTTGVRMYHDQALYKEPAGGFTPWHVDQYYWPMETGKSVTAWIPLQAVPIEMGPLSFGKGSHIRHIARDIEIGAESEKIILHALKEHKIIEVFEAFDLGEVSFHYGWTLHRAGPNITETPRKIQTVIYMDENMRLAEPRNENHRNDWEAFSPSTKVGEVMADPKNPVMYSARG